MTAKVYVALGSNLGDRRAYLARAAERLGSYVNELQASSVYETEPWGYEDQPAFLNQVLAGETELEPLQLLTRLKQIETELGREERFRYGPREIDLDLLLYGRQVLRTPQLELPHPRLHERAFVLVPLADLAPDLVHPVLEKTIVELLEEVDTDGIERYRPEG